MTHQILFDIMVPAGPLSIRDKIILNFALQNQEQIPVYVNTRFAVAPYIGEIRPMVVFEGKAVPFRYMVRLVPIKNSDFVLLDPGQRVIGGYELTGGFKIGQPGTYTVTAEYVSEHIPPELSKHIVFKGRVSSPAVRLILT